MKNKIKILHLEDNPNDAELIQEILISSGLDVEINVAPDKQVFINALENTNFDIVISDYNLPEYDGLKALLEIQQRKKNIPFIFCSGAIGEERAVQCLQLGAMDYVLKDRIDRLVPAIKRAVRLVEETNARQEAESQLKRVLFAIENTNDAIMVTDTKGIINYINPYFTTMYEWNRDEVVNKVTPKILKSGAHSGEFYKNLWDNLAANKSLKLEMVNKTKSGKHIEIKNMISPNYDESNNLIGYVSIQIDISERKKHEREAERAKKEAAEMNKLKSYFLSNISHEMRTPLISILGFSEILVNELEDAEQRESAEHIFNGGKRLMGTINKIISLQNIENEKIEVSLKEFNLIETIEQLYVKAKRAADKKALECTLNVEEKNILLNSDPVLIEDALGNVIDNSLKFTEKGGIEISVKVEEENGELFANIKIIDSGVGITAEKIKYIFDEFRQGSEGMNRSAEGMGIGLSIAKQYIGLLNGKISISSEINKGTIVSIKMPILQTFVPAVPQALGSSETTIVKDETGIKSDKPLVLFVEDNESNRLLFKRILSKEFQIEEAEDGLTGIAKAEEYNYNIILMDINLGPGIDGIETFQRIRKLPKYSSTPVIAVTAFGFKEDKQKFLDLGFTDYMQKPVDKNELISLMKKIIVN